jgi:Flp pilus assembly protein TadD
MMRYAVIAGAAFAVLLAAFFLWRPEENVWRVRNFPTVYLAPAIALDPLQAQRNAAIDLTTGLRDGLDRFTAMDVINEPSPAADYRLDATLRAVPGGTRINVTLTHLDTGHVVWSRSALREPVEGRLFDVDEAAATLSARLAQPAGVIHADGDQRNIDINTPYGCWLALRSYWRMMPPEDEPVVRECVTTWATQNPKSAMAHGARSWFLAQDALKLKGKARDDLLAQAHREAQEAVDLQPNDPGAQYSLMRTALYLGLERQARAAADRVIFFNANNPEFMSGVGMFKIMMGDADGEAVLRKALSLHANPPHWVQSGLFFAAVARDDGAAALAAAEDFQDPAGPPLQHAMMAMALARMGRMAEAHGEWAQVVSKDRQYAANPASIFDPLPLAPAIRERSLQWLNLAATGA